MASSSPSSPPFISLEGSHQEPAQVAKISLSTLVHKEEIGRVEHAREANIKRENAVCTTNGTSPWKSFYRSCSQSPGVRNVVWKEGKPYAMEYLFFKSVDTGRLLPMKYAEIRIQFYVDRNRWERQNKMKDVRKRMEGEMFQIMLLGMGPTMFLRSFVDIGGADIPIVVTDWCDDHVKMALDYWINMSAGRLSDKESRIEFCKIARTSSYECNEPSFYEADLLVRSLLQDPSLEYVPPFILFFQINGGKFTPLFTSPHLAPPSPILDALPRGCGAPQCTDDKCRDEVWNGIDSASLKSLDANMIKCDKKDPSFSSLSANETRFWRLKALWEPKEQLCNTWGCNVSDSQEYRARGMALKRCMKCKEVLYCSTIHQRLDWEQHKTVCETRPDP